MTYLCVWKRSRPNWAGVGSGTSKAPTKMVAPQILLLTTLYQSKVSKQLTKNPIRARDNFVALRQRQRDNVISFSDMLGSCEFRRRALVGVNTKQCFGATPKRLKLGPMASCFDLPLYLMIHRREQPGQ